MKKTLLLFTFAFCAKGIFAQSPTITSENNWTVGDKTVTYSTDSTGIEPGKAGTGVTWDFSGIKATDSMTVTYMAPSASPVGSSFSNANICSYDQRDSQYTFYNMNSTKVEEVGIAQYNNNNKNYDAVPFSNTLILVKYPVTYGYTNTDTYAAHATVSQVADAYVNGKIDENADAYGTLKIRNKTYDNVLRIKAINGMKDSLVVPFLGSFVIYDTTVAYTYYIPGKKSPIMTITYETQRQDSDVSVTKTVTFNDVDHVHTTGIADGGNTDASMELYPNPANGSTILKVNSTGNGTADIRITNQLGEVVASMPAQNIRQGANEISIDLRGKPAGMYFVNVMQNGQNSSQKLIVY